MSYGSVFCFFILLSKYTSGLVAKSSLTFVIDDTGSMYDDIDRVKYGANLVFDTVLNNNSSQIENFILVTFNDPVAGKLHTVTRDRDLFKKKLESLIVYGGDDCPELSLSGIELALKESLPNSYIYVFTDASAKDVHLLSYVQNLAIKKRSQIVFLLTGECSSDRNDPHFQSYYKLASATSGQVFHIEKQDIDEILSYVAETVSHPKTVVKITSVPPGYNNNFTVPVDGGIKVLVISGSGDVPKITKIQAPDGTELDIIHVVDLPGAVVVKVPDTMPGNYTVVGGGKTTTNFVITADTDIHFKLGFLAVEPTSILGTASQPKADEKTHIAIQLITTNNNAVLSTLQIMDVDENVIEEMPLKLINKRHMLYTTDKCMPPNTLFKVAVKGYSDKARKSPFTRISSTAIEPQKPELVKPEDKAPSVEVAEKIIHVKYKEPVKIPCKINGYPKPDTIWIDNNGTVLKSTGYVVESPYDYLNVLEIKHATDNGNYTCKATNSFGESSAVIYIEVEKVNPKINKTTKVIHTKKDRDVEISCRVYRGNPTPVIFWFVRYPNSQEYEQLDSTKEKISLKNVQDSDAGDYRCVAINDFGHDDHIISLVVEYAPIIRSGKTSERSIEGRPTSLTCKVKGVPRPHVEWFHEGVKIISDRKRHIYRDNSLRFQGSIENVGRYTCVASNIHGSANRTVLVDYVGPVSITPPEQSTFFLRVGESVVLPCHAEGYPKPTIKWLFYSSDYNDTAEEIRSSDPVGSLNLRSLQLDQDGYYVCVASNIKTSANMTYKVKVLAPPHIERTAEKIFTAVLGDLVAILPCKATGNPKPDITWTKDGLHLAAGTEWYDIKDDGTLFIKNVDRASAGSYVCHAENVFGDDQERFTLTVKPYPDELPTKTITLEEGNSENIECDIPHTRVDALRWYKDRRIISEGELALRNVQLSDSGIYTCRVNTMLKSQSRSVRIEVGSKPTFVSEAATLVNFEEDSPAFLDCTAFGEPVPEVKWYHEDTLTDFTDMVYDPNMTFETRGKYTCVVSNPYGRINRTFEISSRDCILNVEKDFTSYQPLMDEPYRGLPSFDNINGFLRIPFGENIILSCPSGFRNIPELEVMATCEKENTFRVGRHIYEYSELACREEVEIKVRKTGRQCLTEDFEEIQVGFMSGGRFLEVFEACLDSERNAPVYAKHRLRRSLADVEPKGAKWYNDDLLPLNVDEIYDCGIQISHMSSLLGKWFHPGDMCCFRKRQLINPRDLPVGLAQKTAFSYLNVVPQWSTCNSKNWDLLEKQVRSLAQSSYEDFLVWTGTTGNLKLESSAGALEVIRLEDNNYLPQTVPQYLWKIIQSSDTNSSLAIVQLNIPDLTLAEAYKHMVCKDICRDVPWLKGHNWRNPTDGYTFCCSLDDFENAFGYTGRFGSENRNIFYGTSELSPHSLI